MIGRALVVLAGLANFGAVAALAGGGDGESSGLLTQANEAYVFEELDRAKALYEQAAEAGSVAAHYYLAHLFELDRESRVRHYEQAARAGYVSAMQNALDLLFYEASGGDAQPLPALDIYRDGTAANPALADEMHRDIDTLTGCVEAGDLDTQRFVEVHGLDVGPSPQSLWRLAEDAANTGRFGVPDARLGLKLLCRAAPVHIEPAVRALYWKWQDNNDGRFDVCERATGAIALRYCLRKRKVELNYIEVAGDMYSPTSYRLLAQWGPRECGILVLHLRDKCSSLVFVIMNERDAEFGQDFNSYAHFSFEGKNFIAPVTNLLRLEEFLEILRQGQRTTHR